MKEEDKKSTVERRKYILETIDSEGQVKVNELSSRFNVSEVTIRNDLGKLEKKNQLIRARGGAIKSARVGIDFEISDKHKINLKEKSKIGKEAAKLIKSGDTIIIDSGTTTMEIAKNLNEHKELTVITNALNIANNLAKNKEISVIVPGGFLRPESLSLVGPPAEKGFGKYFCDLLFLGVDGFDIEHGLSTPNVEEAHLNQKMIEVSKKVVLVADSSKFFKRSLAHICKISKIDILVTDDEIEQDDKRRLEDLGVKVIVA